VQLSHVDNTTVTDGCQNKNVDFSTVGRVWGYCDIITVLLSSSYGDIEFCICHEIPNSQNHITPTQGKIV
jgi:hypothetical protein